MDYNIDEKDFSFLKDERIIRFMMNPEFTDYNRAKHTPKIVIRYPHYKLDDFVQNNRKRKLQEEQIEENNLKKIVELTVLDIYINNSQYKEDNKNNNEKIIDKVDQLSIFIKEKYNFYYPLYFSKTFNQFGRNYSNISLSILPIDVNKISYLNKILEHFIEKDLLIEDIKKNYNKLFIPFISFNDYKKHIDSFIYYNISKTIFNTIRNNNNTVYKIEEFLLLNNLTSIGSVKSIDYFLSLFEETKYNNKPNLDLEDLNLISQTISDIENDPKKYTDELSLLLGYRKKNFDKLSNDFKADVILNTGFYLEILNTIFEFLLIESLDKYKKVEKQQISFINNEILKPNIIDPNQLLITFLCILKVLSKKYRIPQSTLYIISKYLIPNISYPLFRVEHQPITIKLDLIFVSDDMPYKILSTTSIKLVQKNCLLLLPIYDILSLLPTFTENNPRNSWDDSVIITITPLIEDKQSNSNSIIEKFIKEKEQQDIIDLKKDLEYYKENYGNNINNKYKNKDIPHFPNEIFETPKFMYDIKISGLTTPIIKDVPIFEFNEKMDRYEFYPFASFNGIEFFKITPFKSIIFAENWLKEYQSAYSYNICIMTDLFKKELESQFKQEYIYHYYKEIENNQITEIKWDTINIPRV